MYNIDELYSDIEFEIVGDKIRMKVKGDTSKDKGYFETEAELKSKHPVPAEGSAAFVGTPYPGTVYACKQYGVWVNTGKTPNIPPIVVPNYVIDGGRADSTYTDTASVGGGGANI